MSIIGEIASGGVSFTVFCFSLVVERSIALLWGTAVSFAVIHYLLQYYTPSILCFNSCFGQNNSHIIEKKVKGKCWDQSTLQIMLHNQTHHGHKMYKLKISLNTIKLLDTNIQYDSHCTRFWRADITTPRTFEHSYSNELHWSISCPKIMFRYYH